MKPLFSIVSYAGFFAASALLASVERTTTDTYHVQPGGSLTIHAHSGSIKIKTGSSDTVKLEIREKIDASTEKEADEVLSKLTLVKEQNGSDLNVTANYEGRSGFHFSFGIGPWNSWPPVQLDFTVTVPENYSVNLKTSGGEITVGDLHGAILANTAGGDLHFGNIDGTITGKTSGGSIDLESCSGKVSLHSSGGNVAAGTLAGPAELGSSAGSIRVKSAKNMLTAHSSAGSVSVGFEGPLTGNSDLSSSAGSVAVTVPEAANFILDASTSAGSVKCSLPISLESGSDRRSRMLGKIGAGGPTLKLRSSAGGIRVSS